MKVSTDIYKIVEKMWLDDVNGMGYVLEHKKTGAKLVLIENDDDNKVFTATFRTPALNNHGAAHVIEHSVLSGSERYPLKETYVELVKGSLHTYLNATTGMDRTSYPVASCNNQEFKNLMNVYLDGIFHPLALKRPEVFMQEGIRYNYDTEKNEIVLSGVVYNEMQGVTSPEVLLFRQINESLFPDTPYRYTLAGKPEDIPELTFEEFKEYYNKYYHPSNCFLYLYGNVDFEERLDYLDKEYLQFYDRKEIDSSYPIQMPREKVTESIGYYPIGKDENEDDRTYMSYSVALPAVHDATRCITLKTINYALTSTTTGIIRQRLRAKNIGRDCWGSITCAQKQPNYSVIVMNAKKEQKDEFVRIVRDSIRDVIQEGFSHEVLEAAIHKLEYEYMETEHASGTLGIKYLTEIYKKWLYDEEDIFDFIDMSSVFDKLRNKIDDRYFETQLKELIYESRHASVVVLCAKAGLQEEKEQERKKLLRQKLDSMTQEEVKKLIKQNEEFKSFLKTPDSKELIEMIPILERKDLEKAQNPLKNEETYFGGIKTILHEENTNGIGCFNFSFDFSHISYDELPYVGILADIISMADTNRHDYRKLGLLIARTMGDFKYLLTLYDGTGLNNVIRPAFEIRIETFYRKFETVVKIITEIINETVFDDDQILEEGLKRISSTLKASFLTNSAPITEIEAKKILSTAATIKSKIAGIEYMKFVNQLLEDINRDSSKLSKISDKLAEVLHKVCSIDNLIVSYTGERKSFEQVGKMLEQFSKNIHRLSMPNYVEQIQVENSIVNKAYVYATELQCVSMIGPLPECAEINRGALAVLAQILKCEYLWQNIRAEGGAYACDIKFPFGKYGIITSHRDPHLITTIETYKNMIEYIENFEASERQMRKYIIGVINMFDEHQSPSQRGQDNFASYLSEEPEGYADNIRNQIINTTDEDIRTLAPIIRYMLANSSIVVAGSLSKIKEHKDMFDQIEII